MSHAVFYTLHGGTSADNMYHVLPQFPDFKLIEFTDKTDIENLLQGVSIYSDFNFTSLHVWNVQNEMQVSRLNENLVVRFSDYITGEPFFSFFGINDPVLTAITLIEYSEATLRLPYLKLIPSPVATQLCEMAFSVKEDRDAFDYIYPLSFFKSLPERPAKCKPTAHLRAFLSAYPEYTASTVTPIEANAAALKEVFEKWAYNKGMNYRSLHEYTAFDRLLKTNNNDVLITTVSLADTQIGFMINEIVDSENAICHFYKADITYKGIYETVLWEASKVLYEKGIRQLNIEQDLGIETLRRSKGKYKQHSFLRKYIVSTK